MDSVKEYLIRSASEESLESINANKERMLMDLSPSSAPAVIKSGYGFYVTDL